MNKEKWKESIRKLSAGARKISFRSTAVLVAAFAMVGVASLVNFSDTTLAQMIPEFGDTRTGDGRMMEAIESASLQVEKNMASRVLQYAYTDVRELGAQTMSYTAVSTYEDYRGIGSLHLPGTRKSIEVECPGSVTGYYEADEVSWQTDTESRVIYVTLPETVYVENVLEEESLTRTDYDNFLNPISETDLQECIELLKEQGLEQVIEEGLYDLVEANARDTIENTFSVLKDYGVIFSSEASLNNGSTAEEDGETDIGENDTESDDTEESSGSWYDNFWGREEEEEDSQDSSSGWGSGWNSVGGLGNGGSWYDYGSSGLYGSDNSDTYDTYGSDPNAYGSYDGSGSESNGSSGSDVDDSYGSEESDWSLGDTWNAIRDWGSNLQW